MSEADDSGLFVNDDLSPSSQTRGRWLLATRRRGRHGVPFTEWRFARSPGWATCLPTLVNVFQGDMALVGPRPVSDDDPLAADVLHPRFSVRPGLVNPWSVQQRARIDYDTEGDADQEYVRTRTWRGDVGLLFRAVLTSRPAQVLSSPAETVSILALPIHNLSMREALDRLDAGLEGGAPMQVGFLNADCVNVAVTDTTYRDALRRAALILPDGIGLRIAAHWIGTELRQNVNGTDLFPRLCARLALQKRRVFLLGGRPGVADGVGDWITRHHPGVVVAGTQHGYFSAADNDSIVERIRQARPDVLLVAFGAPRQDVWLARYLSVTGAKVGLGVGGLFDFYSGRIPRAPKWVRELNCEWMYRLIQEPRRLWKRYLYGNGLFLARIWRERRGLRKVARALRALESPS